MEGMLSELLAGGAAGPMAQGVMPPGMMGQGMMPEEALPPEPELTTIEAEPLITKLSPERKLELGSLISQMIRDGIAARGRLEDRWRKNLRHYQNEPPGTAQFPYPGAPQYHAPLVQPKIDALVAAIGSALSEQRPYFRAVSTVADGERMSEVENVLHWHMNNAKYDLKMRLAATIAAICGKGIIGVQYLSTDFFDLPNQVESLRPVHGGVKSFAGIHLTIIHPESFVVYPASSNTITDARLTGHMFKKRLRECIELAFDGTYDKEGVKRINTTLIQNSSSGSGSEPGRNSSFDLTELDLVSVHADKPVELYQVIVKLRLKEDKLEDNDASPEAELDRKKGDYKESYYLAVVAPDTNSLLSIEPYSMSRPWYFDIAFHSEYGSFWPASSVAQNLQGLQILYNELHNLFIGGSWFAAVPPTLLSGGMTRLEKDVPLTPGELIQTEGQGQLSNPVARFDPAPIPIMIRQVETLADRVTRISDLSLNIPLNTVRSASEVSSLDSGKAAGLNQYLQMLSVGLSEVGDFARELLAQNYYDWKQVYGDKLKCEGPEALNGAFIIEVNGKTPSSNPQAVIASVGVIIESAANTPIGQHIDWREALQAIVRAVQIPNGERIILDADTARANIEAQQKAQQEQFQLQAQIELAKIEVEREKVEVMRQKAASDAEAADKKSENDRLKVAVDAVKAAAEGERDSEERDLDRQAAKEQAKEKASQAKATAGSKKK